MKNLSIPDRKPYVQPVLIRRDRLAQVAALWLPTAWIGDPHSLVVIGMAAVLAAVTHAPLMAITMVLEMTNEFQLTVPVMLACGIAYAMSTRFGTKPLYGNPIEAARKPSD